MKILLLTLFLINICYSQDTTNSSIQRPDTIITFNDQEPDTIITGKDTSLFESAYEDSLKSVFNPIQTLPLSNNSFFIGDTLIEFTELRNFYNILDLAPMSFTFEYGETGHPNQSLLYGAEDITILEDGIPLNNRGNNYFDLHNIQFGGVDSVEIIKSPRSFLYGVFKNRAAVNIITKDELIPLPYTRIKYNEGDFEEGYFDGIINTFFFKKLNVFAEFSNQKSERRFQNTAYSLWQGKVKAKYFLNETINFIGSYDFNYGKTGLFGGINVDSISSRFQNDIEDILYDVNLAPVNSSDAEQKNRQHRFRFTTLYELKKKQLTFINSSLAFYYHSLQDEVTYSKWPDRSYKVKTYGVNFNGNVNFQNLSLQLNTGYEKNDIDNIRDLTSPYIRYFNNYFFGFENNFYAASIFSAYIADSLLVPSFYLKYNKNFDYFLDENGIKDAGTDISVHLKNFNIYAGISTNNMQLEVQFLSRYFQALAGYVNDLDNVDSYITNAVSYDDYYHVRNNADNYYANVNFNFSKIYFENKAILYESSYLPEFTIRSGVYYRDILFNENLELKTGLLFNYVGKQALREIPSFNRFDFTLAGRIQRTVNIYFTVENLLDTKYYLVKYYPMPGAHYRFGVMWELFN